MSEKKADIQTLTVNIDRHGDGTVLVNGSVLLTKFQKNITLGSALFSPSLRSITINVEACP